MKSLTLFLTLIGIFLLTSPSCKKDKPVYGCNVENPIMNLEWLKSSKNYYVSLTRNDWSEVNIYMYDYKNSNAFQFETKKTGTYDITTSIYNCEGNLIATCGGLQPPPRDTSCFAFFRSATDQKLLWSKSYK